jgi:hypothetical protein
MLNVNDPAALKRRVQMWRVFAPRQYVATGDIYLPAHDATACRNLLESVLDLLKDRLAVPGAPEDLRQILTFPSVPAFTVEEMLQAAIDQLEPPAVKPQPKPRG